MTSEWDRSETLLFEQGVSSESFEWLSENTDANSVRSVTSVIEGSTADDLSTLCLLVSTVKDKFVEWRTIISVSDYDPVLFLATVVPVVKSLVPPSEIGRDPFRSDLILALLGYKSNHTDVRGFDPELARGYMVERILTGGNSVEKTSVRYLRWLNRNHAALSRHTEMLRQQKSRISHEYLKALVAADLPVPLGAGAL